MLRIAVFVLQMLMIGSVSAADPNYKAPESVPGAMTIDVKMAEDLHRDGVAFIDVRNPRLYARRHIPGAVHLDLQTRFSAANLRAVVAENQPLVVYCSGVKCSRSSTAVEFAVSWGFSQVKYFRGGIVAWRDAGLAMDSAD